MIWNGDFSTISLKIRKRQSQDIFIYQVWMDILKPGLVIEEVYAVEANTTRILHMSSKVNMPSKYSQNPQSPSTPIVASCIIFSFSSELN